MMNNGLTRRIALKANKICHRFCAKRIPHPSWNLLSDGDMVGAFNYRGFNYCRFCCIPHMEIQPRCKMVRKEPSL